MWVDRCPLLAFYNLLERTGNSCFIHQFTVRAVLNILEADLRKELSLSDDQLIHQILAVDEVQLLASKAAANGQPFLVSDCTCSLYQWMACELQRLSCFSRVCAKGGERPHGDPHVCHMLMTILLQDTNKPSAGP